MPRTLTDARASVVVSWVSLPTLNNLLSDHFLRKFGNPRRPKHPPATEQLVIQSLLPGFLMKEESDGVNHGLDQSDAAGNGNRSCEQISHSKTDRQMNREICDCLGQVCMSFDNRRHRNPFE